MINKDKIKTSDLPEEKNPEIFWIHGYTENKEGNTKSSRLHSGKVVEEIGKTTKAMEQKIASLSTSTTNELKKKADAKDSKGKSVVYGETTTELTEANKAKIPNVDAVIRGLDALKESVKTDEEKFPVHIYVDFINNDKPFDKVDLFYLTGIKSLDAKYKIVYDPYSNASGSVINYLYIDSTRKPYNRVALYTENMHYIVVGPPYIAEVKVVTKNTTLPILSMNSVDAHLDLSEAPSIKTLSWLYIPRLDFDFSNIEGLDLLNIQIGKLKHFKVDGRTISTLWCNRNRNLTTIEIINQFTVLKELSIFDTPISRDELMNNIEPKWVSQNGSSEGKIEIDSVLFKTLSDEDKLKFTNKNISIVIR